MTNPLDTLRPEVRRALADFDSWIGALEYHEGQFPRARFKTIRAELLRLAAVEQKWKQWINDGMRVVVSEQPK